LTDPQAPAACDAQFTVQFTATALPFCVAVNCCCPPAESVTGFGLTTSGLVVVEVVIVTVAVAVLVVSAWEIAVIVTVAGVGTALGAVYKPVVEINPTV
jgi:hypothetical protein